MPKSVVESDAYLNGRFRDGGAIAALGTVYLALGSADFTAANVTANELAAGVGGYGRIAISTTNADWSAPVTQNGMRMISNTGTLSGGTATADLNGGVAIPAWALYTASSGGNLVRYGLFSTPKQILVGDAIVIAPGALQIFE
jgi:hypothetical protein